MRCAKNSYNELKCQMITATKGVKKTVSDKQTSSGIKDKITRMQRFQNSSSDASMHQARIDIEVVPAPRLINKEVSERDVHCAE